MLHLTQGPNGDRKYGLTTNQSAETSWKNCDPNKLLRPRLRSRFYSGLGWAKKGQGLTVRV